MYVYIYTHMYRYTHLPTIVYVHILDNQAIRTLSITSYHTISPEIPRTFQALALPGNSSTWAALVDDSTSASDLFVGWGELSWLTEPS